MKNDSEILSDKEKKLVLGGYGAGKGWCCFNDGECVLSGCSSDASCIQLYGEGWCDL